MFHDHFIFLISVLISVICVSVLYLLPSVYKLIREYISYRKTGYAHTYKSVFKNDIKDTLPSFMIIFCSLIITGLFIGKYVYYLLI
jgi:hypothetical protein